MHLYFTDRDDPITKDASNWSMDDEIYYDMDLMPDVHVLAAAYTPKAAGGRNAGAQRRADELTGGGKRVSVATSSRRSGPTSTPSKVAVRRIAASSRSRGTSTRTSTGPTTARSCCAASPGPEAAERRRVPRGRRDRRRPALCRGRTHPPAEGRGEDRGTPEFDLSLVAAEPLIHKAMNIDWDEKGRLWVSETPEYPNGRRVPNTALWKDTGSLARSQQRDPEDTISFLTDTNGDGVMDRKHVFADKLELVTGFVFYKNGVIAATAPDIWYLEDTNGDEVADKRTKLYTGLGIADTHAVINNLRWGLDGWIYATHGYSVGTVTSPDGRRNSAATAAASSASSPMAARSSSTAAAAATPGASTSPGTARCSGRSRRAAPCSFTPCCRVGPREGRLPNTNRTRDDHGQEHLPGDAWPEQAYVQIDLVGQFTAAAGCAVYDGGAWPDKWRYRLLHRRADAEHRAPAVRAPDGVSYTTEKEAGRQRRPSSSAAPISGSARSRRVSAPTARSTSSISTTRR